MKKKQDKTNLDYVLDSIYSTLKEGIEEINWKKQEMKYLQERIDSGIYSIEIQQSDINKRDKLMAEIRDSIPGVLARAQKCIDAEVSRLQAEDRPKGADLTEDAKLLNSGIKLGYDDIVSLWEKPENQTATMKRLIADYTERNKIIQPGNDKPFKLTYRGNTDVIRDVKRAESVLKYYKRWIDSDNNLQLLDRFMPDQAEEAADQAGGEE